MTILKPPFIAAFIGACLSGCTFQTAFRAASPIPDDGSVLVVTHAVLREDGRRAFHRASMDIASALPERPGLVGYALRRTLIGDEAWTLTLWRDDAARVDFVSSDRHRTAIAAQATALRCARFARLPWQGPAPSWPDALALLDRHARTYTYGAASPEACAAR